MAAHGEDDNIAEMVLLSKLISVTGKQNDNLSIDGASAKWEDHISHKFVGLSPMRNITSINFTYSGTGHAHFGICCPDGEEVKKMKVRCKKDHGKGLIELKENNLKLIIDAESQEWTLPEGTAGVVKPFFDIRFGDLTISVPGQQFNIPTNGHVNGDALSLDKSYSADGLCYIENPLTTMEDVEVAISSADGAHYWTVKIYLTNEKPTNQTPTGYLLNEIKNYSGTIRLVKNEQGICIQYKMKKKIAKTSKIHLSKEVYIRLHLFRSKVVTTICKNANPYISYVSPEHQSCVSQISQEEMVVDYDTDTRRHSRPTEEFNQAPIIKSPRLESQPWMNEDQTYAKHTYITDIDIAVTKLGDFHKILDSAKQMQKGCSSTCDYIPMFMSMKVSLEEQLHKLENNVFVQPCHIEHAKQKLKDTFQSSS